MYEKKTKNGMRTSMIKSMKTTKGMTLKAHDNFETDGDEYVQDCEKKQMIYV